MAQFDKRFAKHEQELRTLYLQLYHGGQNTYDVLVESLRGYANSRSGPLQLLDAAREENPCLLYTSRCV